MNIQPVGDRVVLKPLEAETVTASGLVIPDTADKEKSEQAKVVAIGEGEKISGLGLKKGQTVLFSKYGGNEIEVDGVEYKVVGHDDVLAIIA